MSSSPETRSKTAFGRGKRTSPKKPASSSPRKPSSPAPSSPRKPGPRGRSPSPKKKHADAGGAVGSAGSQGSPSEKKHADAGGAVGSAGSQGSPSEKNRAVGSPRSQGSPSEKNPSPGGLDPKTVNLPLSEVRDVPNPSPGLNTEEGKDSEAEHTADRPSCPPDPSEETGSPKKAAEILVALGSTTNTTQGSKEQAVSHQAAPASPRHQDFGDFHTVPSPMAKGTSSDLEADNDHLEHHPVSADDRHLPTSPHSSRKLVARKSVLLLDSHGTGAAGFSAIPPSIIRTTVATDVPPELLEDHIKIKFKRNVPFSISGVPNQGSQYGKDDEESFSETGASTASDARENEHKGRDQSLANPVQDVVTPVETGESYVDAAGEKDPDALGTNEHGTKEHDDLDDEDDDPAGDHDHEALGSNKPSGPDDEDGDSPTEIAETVDLTRNTDDEDEEEEEEEDDDEDDEETEEEEQVEAVQITNRAGRKRNFSAERRMLPVRKAKKAKRNNDDESYKEESTEDEETVAVAVEQEEPEVVSKRSPKKSKKGSGSPPKKGAGKKNAGAKKSSPTRKAAKKTAPKKKNPIEEQPTGPSETPHIERICKTVGCGHVFYVASEKNSKQYCGLCNHTRNVHRMQLSRGRTRILNKFCRQVDLHITEPFKTAFVMDNFELQRVQSPLAESEAVIQGAKILKKHGACVFTGILDDCQVALLEEAGKNIRLTSELQKASVTGWTASVGRLDAAKKTLEDKGYALSPQVLRELDHLRAEMAAYSKDYTGTLQIERMLKGLPSYNRDGSGKKEVSVIISAVNEATNQVILQQVIETSCDFLNNLHSNGKMDLGVRDACVTRVTNKRYKVRHDENPQQALESFVFSVTQAIDDCCSEHRECVRIYSRAWIDQIQAHLLRACEDRHFGGHRFASANYSNFDPELMFADSPGLLQVYQIIKNFMSDLVKHVSDYVVQECEVFASYIYQKQGSTHKQLPHADGILMPFPKALLYLGEESVPSIIFPYHRMKGEPFMERFSVEDRIEDIQERFGVLCPIKEDSPKNNDFFTMQDEFYKHIVPVSKENMKAGYLYVFLPDLIHLGDANKTKCDKNVLFVGTYAKGERRSATDRQLNPGTVMGLLNYDYPTQLRNVETHAMCLGYDEDNTNHLYTLTGLTKHLNESIIKKFGEESSENA